MFPVRSFGVAAFVIGQGHEPIDVEWQDAVPVFLFSDNAHEAMTKYASAKSVLAALLARKGMAR